MDDHEKEDDFEDDDPNAPWNRDPIEGLPAVIEPGRIAMEFWQKDPFNGEHVVYDFIFTWHGGRQAEWFYDISMANSGMSVMSSAPIGGTANWENGTDAEVTFLSDEFDLDEERTLGGVAPKDDAIHLPRTWVDFGRHIAGAAEGFIQ